MCVWWVGVEVGCRAGGNVGMVTCITPCRMALQRPAAPHAIT